VTYLVHPWQNPVDPLDVTGNEGVTPRDALVIINSLNSLGPRRLPVPPVAPNLPPPYLDVSGDDAVTALDALNIINFINARPASHGEGESGIAASSAPSVETFRPASGPLAAETMGVPLSARSGEALASDGGAGRPATSHPGDAQGQPSRGANALSADKELDADEDLFAGLDEILPLIAPDIDRQWHA
jgi:hypothetical protein